MNDDLQVRAYAQYIHLDIDVFPQLRWIAQQGLHCPLPDGWTLERIAGNHFFKNSNTGEQQESHPMDTLYVDLAAKETKRCRWQNQTYSPRGSSKSRGLENSKSVLDDDDNDPQRSGTGRTVRLFLLLCCVIALVHYGCTVQLLRLQGVAVVPLRELHRGQDVPSSVIAVVAVQDHRVVHDMEVVENTVAQPIRDSIEMTLLKDSIMLPTEDTVVVKSPLLPPIEDVAIVPKDGKKTEKEESWF